LLIGAIEAGGTKFVCGVGTGDGRIMERVRIPTGRPEETVRPVIEFFRDKPIQAIGIGSFGPIDVNPASPQYGHITTTPKPGWSGFPLLATIREALGVPAGWDTGVNAAALGEAKWGAARGLDSCVYFTIGTGVGMGVYAEKRRLHGLVHPEAGHIPVRRHPEDHFAGACPYHGDCLEGMAAGPALEKRWGKPGGQLPADHPAWAIEAHYIAQAVMTAILMLSPHKVILGGGVMHQAQLFPAVRDAVKRGLNGYVKAPEILERIHEYIVPPGLGDDAGLCGALALGLEALQRNG